MGRRFGDRHPTHKALIGGRMALYYGGRETDYSATRTYGISAADPGAVPGASTKFSAEANSFGDTDGGEIGSTRVVKVRSALGMVPPLSGHHIVANDNYSEVRLAA